MPAKELYDAGLPPGLLVGLGYGDELKAAGVPNLEQYRYSPDGLKAAGWRVAELRQLEQS